MAFIYGNTRDERAGKVEVEGHIIEERPKSIKFDDGLRVAHLAKSQIKIYRYPAGRATVMLPKWLAKKVGYV